MPSEGFSFGVDSCSRLVVVCNRSQPFGGGRYGAHIRKSFRDLDGSMMWRFVGNSEFTAQARRFVRSAAFFAVTLELGFGGLCFWCVGCGCDIGILRLRLLPSCVFVDGSVLRTVQNYSKRVVWCKLCGRHEHDRTCEYM